MSDTVWKFGAMRDADVEEYVRAKLAAVAEKCTRHAPTQPLARTGAHGGAGRGPAPQPTKPYEFDELYLDESKAEYACSTCRAVHWMCDECRLVGLDAEVLPFLRYNLDSQPRLDNPPAVELWPTFAMWLDPDTVDCIVQVISTAHKFVKSAHPTVTSTTTSVATVVGPTRPAAETAPCGGLAPTAAAPEAEDGDDAGSTEEATCSVSQRDLQRVFKAFEWFYTHKRMRSKHGRLVVDGQSPYIE